eukprot:8433965-Karenia_brevis.AAC.1
MGLLEPWQASEYDIKATENLAQTKFLVPDGYVAGTDASGGEHASDPRLRKVGWAFVILDLELKVVAIASGNILGKQSTNK